MLSIKVLFEKSMFFGLQSLEKVSVKSSIWYLLKSWLYLFVVSPQKIKRLLSLITELNVLCNLIMF